MQDQHTKITGYRDLSQAEIDLMNEIKATEVVVAELFGRVASLAAERSTANPAAPRGPIAHIEIEACRQRSVARQEFESAFMRLVRSVARPASPWAV